MANPLECAAVLLPQLEIENRSHAMNGVWLKLVTEKTFQTFKKKADAQSGANVGLPIEGVPVDFSGFFNGSWEDFQTQRSEYLSRESTTLTETSTVALLRQSLSDKQLEAWLACIGRTGLFLNLSDDSAAAVTAHLQYSGIPGSTLKAEIQITNGTSKGENNFSRELAHDAAFTFEIDRTLPSRVTVIVNSASFSASAVSIWPPPAIEKHLTFGAINANQFSVGVNVTDDREINPGRPFVHAIDPASPTWFYIPALPAPEGLSPSSRLFLNYSSAGDSEIRVAVVPDEATAKVINPFLRIKLPATGHHAGWDTRKSVDLGAFPVKEGVNYIVIASDTGRQMSLLNGFWFVGTPGIEGQ